MTDTAWPAAALNSSRYSAEHHRVRRQYGPASDYLCEGCCGSRAADWATVHGRTGLEPMLDRVPLCKPCHIRYDESGHRTPHTEAARQKMSSAQRAPLSAESRAKISAALTGREQTVEHAARNAAARRGLKRSAEARRNMSEAAKRRAEKGRS